MTSPDVAQIVRGLTKAQRDILVDLFDGTPRYNVDVSEADMGVLAAHRLTTTFLTPLGLQVRAAITGEGM